VSVELHTAHDTPRVQRRYVSAHNAGEELHRLFTVVHDARGIDYAALAQSVLIQSSAPGDFAHNAELDELIRLSNVFNVVLHTVGPHSMSRWLLFYGIGHEANARRTGRPDAQIAFVSAEIEGELVARGML